MFGVVPVIGPDQNQQMLHKELSMFLYSMNTGNPLKSTSILTRLYEQGEVELDQPDLEFLETIITNCRNAPDYMTSKALEIIAKAKLDKK